MSNSSVFKLRLKVLLKFVYGWLGGVAVTVDVGVGIKRSCVRFLVGPLSSYLGQLGLPSLLGRLIEYRPDWPGLRWGAFTCVGWQVTLGDPI